MVKKTSTRSTKRVASVEPRDLWLAGLGAVSLTRKQGVKFFGTLVDEGKQFQGKFEGALVDFQSQAMAGAERVRAQVEAFVTPLRQRAGATLGTVKAEVESRLSPVFDKLGVKRKPATRVHGGAKRVVRKAKVATKRAVRKAKAA